MVDLWRRIVSRASGRTLRRAQFQLAHWQAQTRDTFTTLRSYPRLTETGQFFVDMMGDTITARTDGEGIPEDVAARVMDAAVAHPVRRRLRHLRPEARAVGELADAWAAGAPYPARQPTVEVVVPCGHAAAVDGYRALLCKVATDPSYVL
ncbi:hypothetical protein ACFTUC_09610 [Streptomyces sp. NPDC056944]|uniref:hypothetical protein n=1 Tax=Streptomyces sp. NPDC056944 TaxID=3345972 RepID=UPI0036279109